MTVTSYIDSPQLERRTYKKVGQHVYNESEDNNGISSPLGQEVSENPEKKSAGYFSDSDNDPVKSDLKIFKFHFLFLTLLRLKYVKDNCVHFVIMSTYETFSFSSKVFGEPNRRPVNPAPEGESQTRVNKGE